jgi:hypothetical protein
MCAATRQRTIGTMVTKTGTNPVTGPRTHPPRQGIRPAYYLGRSAATWIEALDGCRRHARRRGARPG